MSRKTQPLLSILVLVAALVQTSAFAENRSRGRTDLERLAAELEARLGPGSVRLERSRSARVPTPRSGVPTPRSGVPTRDADARLTILAAMNRERAERGLVPLRLNEKLSLAATDRIGDMFTKRYFAHVSPDGIDPFVWATGRGYRWRLIGENLAVGFRGASVVDGWMRSPGHRANILQRSFDEVGIAVAEGAPRSGYRGPTVVAMYATR
jgi:uncharacterized protein YkwD